MELGLDPNSNEVFFPLGALSFGRSLQYPGKKKHIYI